ncbi:DUF5082 family protein [Lachnospira multipara]|uniref:DUF5082 family protein n=1 Tax=Lachnospira multipara TaxID=28051 RepID=UPI00048A286D|nr:DUF5082 family protein [Lachnospira multipara]
MTKIDVQRNINYNQKLIAQYRGDNANLESQIHELECLRSKIKSLQDSFGTRQSARKTKLSTLVSSKLKVKTASIYATEMNKLLTGVEYRKAYNGLSYAQEKVNSEISSIKARIDSNNEYIRSYNNKLDYWNEQLKMVDDN